jgi:hypothetical protein
VAGPCRLSRHRHALPTAMPSRLPAMRPVVETMEDRILHAADLAPALLVHGDAGMVLQQPVQTVGTGDAVQRSSEIVFVDLSVPDADALIRDLRLQQDNGRAIDIVTIAADQDGIALITSTLAQRTDLTAVHVLAHGSDGRMQLGSATLDAQTLLTRAGAIASWSDALTGDADLLLYGCDFAQTGVGQQLVRDLAALTGADVAASVDTTGAAALGGNWILEFDVGHIESASAISISAQNAWAGTLAVAFTSGSSGGTTAATTSYNLSHNVNGGNDRLLLVSLVLGNSASSASAVTFNGAALTFVTSQDSPTSHVRVELWSLIAPPVTSGTVAVNLSAASTLVVGATSYSGVDQATPFATPVKGSGFSAAPSLTVPATAGDLVVDTVGATQVSAFIAGLNQTQNFVQTQGTATSDLSGLSTRELGAASVTMSNTLSSVNLNWAAIALRLNQAAGSSPPDHRDNDGRRLRRRRQLDLGPARQQGRGRPDFAARSHHRSQQHAGYRHHRAAVGQLQPDA